MTNPWHRLDESEAPVGPCGWLPEVLARNAATGYLERFARPLTIEAFRERVPACRYDDLVPWMNRMVDGEPDVLFAGRPVAFERTGGSSGGAKLIAYSAEGLLDFRRNLAPWLARTARRHGLRGRAYFSTTPVARAPEWIGSIPVGTSDGAYLGERAAEVLATVSAVPFSVARTTNLDEWRQATLRCLEDAADLELISVWSPTFLLRLLDHLPPAQEIWPRLKVVSCWTGASARRYAQELAARIPHAVIEPKGLLSTEAVVTVPDADSNLALARHGFFEFGHGSELLLEGEIEAGEEYEVVVTTASGLYRYRTGDRVRAAGRSRRGTPILEFVGRDACASDLVGEKLTEEFVAGCLAPIEGFATLVADGETPGYVLVCDRDLPDGALGRLEDALARNPQYAYARRIGQLGPLRALLRRDAQSVVERQLLAGGARLGDVKPAALRPEAFWKPLFEECAP